ncbi:MAG: cbb3-type cytochrome c oxidase subunit I [Desulfobacteraceae bacterium]|jgi:heme/copper-type cytochrome/quinol oxidase subunit 1
MEKNIAKYFITTSLFFFLLGCIEGVMMPTKFLFKDIFTSLFNLPPDQIKTFFGYFVTKIHTHINLIGWVSSAIMGILYFIAPRISGRECYVKWAAYANWTCNTLGVLIIVVAFHLIGVHGLRSGFEVGSPEFRAVGAPYRHMVAVGGVLVLISTILFIWNILKTMYASTPD